MKAKVTLVGRLGAPVEEIKGEGYRMLKSRMAINFVENKQEVTAWYSLVFKEGKFSEKLLTSLKAGSRVCVVGKYSDHIYKNKPNGEFCISRNVDVESIDYLFYLHPIKREEASGGMSHPTQTQPAVNQPSQNNAPPAPHQEGNLPGIVPEAGTYSSKNEYAGSNNIW